MPEGGFGQTWWGRGWQREIYKARWAAELGSWAISPFTVWPCGSRSKWIFVAKPCLVHSPSLLFNSSQNVRPHAARVLDQKSVLLPPSPWSVLPTVSPGVVKDVSLPRMESVSLWPSFACLLQVVANQGVAEIGVYPFCILSSFPEPLGQQKSRYKAPW